MARNQPTDVGPRQRVNVPDDAEAKNRDIEEITPQDQGTFDPTRPTGFDNGRPTRDGESRTRHEHDQ